MDHQPVFYQASNLIIDDLPLSPEAKAEIHVWKCTGQPPFESLRGAPRDLWQQFCETDLGLLYHIVSLVIDLNKRGYASCTVFASKMPMYVVSIFLRQVQVD